MSDSTVSSPLVEQLSRCIEADFEPKRLDQLCETLDNNTVTVDGMGVELVYAIANLAHQLRDGAIQISDTTSDLFREARDLLHQVETTESKRAFHVEDQFAGLLERIDLEASGGFDASEAGDLGVVDGTNKATHRHQLVHGIVHRLRASIRAIQSRLQGSFDAREVERTLKKQAELIDALVTELEPDERMPLDSMAERLGIEFVGSDITPRVAHRGEIHPSLVEPLISLVKQMATVTHGDDSADLNIDQVASDICIQLLTVNDISTDEIRTSAIEHGLLAPDAGLNKTALHQFLLLSGNEQAQNIHDGASLLASVHSLHGTVSTERHKNELRLNVSLHANTSLEAVSVFRIGSDLYGLPSELVVDVQPTSDQNQDNFEQSIAYESSTYPIIALHHITGSASHYVLLAGAHDQVALTVDSVEAPGHVVLTEPAFSHAVGGSTTLMDGRLVVILSMFDLTDPEPLQRSATKGMSQRLLVLGKALMASQLADRRLRIEHASLETRAFASFQECRPHAVLVRNTDIASYTHLLQVASDKDVKVLVELDAEATPHSSIAKSDYQPVATVSELRDALHEDEATNARQ